MLDLIRAIEIASHEGKQLKDSHAWAQRATLTAKYSGILVIVTPFAVNFLSKEVGHEVLVSQDTIQLISEGLAMLSALLIYVADKLHVASNKDAGVPADSNITKPG
jgi:hypothetical protein